MQIIPFLVENFQNNISHCFCFRRFTLSCRKAKLSCDSLLLLEPKIFLLTTTLLGSVCVSCDLFQ